jgi:hypothetical protein
MCTPQRPHPKTTLRGILATLGYELVGPDALGADLVIAWEDATYRRSRYFPASRWGVPPINERCSDISKAHVDAVFASVFGYPLHVDPLVFQGPCIQKSNRNARHDAQLLDCPIEERRPGMVYQRYVDSAHSGLQFVDLRIPVIGLEIPFCWRKTVAADQPSKRLTHAYERCVPTPALDVMTQAEVDRTLRFCASLGLEYGELDAGRDRSDGRLYVYDVNSTPFMRVHCTTEEEDQFAYNALAAAFARQFQPQFTPA